MKSFITTFCLSICLFSLSVLLSCVEGNEADPELITVYEDADGDGFGNADESVEVPTDEIPSGYVSDDTDCDDTNADVNPDADEIPDNDVDENCDGELDATWYLDADEDGYGDPGEAQVSDSQPDGYVSNNDDCDDSDAEVNPDADEIPDNDVDENCDDELDQTWYRDNDDDGFGDPDQSQVSSTQPEGYVANGDDCDDTDESINPDADEIPNNEVDENCDGDLDATWYEDADDDTYGNADVSQVSASQPEGYVSNNEDCNDSDATVYPGASELCDGQINDCTLMEIGADEVDNDGDDYVECGGYVAGSGAADITIVGGGDCNDTNALISPGATEICNGIDDNCNGDVDDDDAGLDAASATTWFQDEDGDGYGIPFVTISACEQPTGYVANSNDCDDSRASANPDGIEICDNGMDDDCDGLIDFADPDCT